MQLTTISPHTREAALAISLLPSPLSDSSDVHCPFTPLDYRCVQSAPRFFSSRTTEGKRLIATLLLLSGMYQLNHSSILPRCSPGLTGRHWRKIGKVSLCRGDEWRWTGRPGEGWCSAGLYGWGSVVECNYSKERGQGGDGGKR